MKSWIISVAAVCLVITVLELFLSEGRMKKYVESFLRLTLVVVMLTPLIGFLKNENILSEITSTEITTQTSKNEQIQIKNEFFRLLTENELNRKEVICSVTLEEDNGEITHVDVYLQEPVINECDGNIYKNSKTVTDTVKKYLGVEGECVRVWAK